MDQIAVRTKFGDDYVATERTFRLGIDIRLAGAMAQRFAGMRVLETCTGAGFTTIALAKSALRVATVEIDPDHQAQARANVARAGVVDRVMFISGDATSDQVLDVAAPFDSAFLDPDWAVSGPEHVYRFRHSNMRPPADALLDKVLHRTSNVALILPPEMDLGELGGLPQHECQSLFLEDRHALYCLYFGALMRQSGSTEVHA